MKYKAICPPEWLSRSAVYQINPRTFSREGTIKAVTDELPKLKDLGFRAVSYTHLKIPFKSIVINGG